MLSLIARLQAVLPQEGRIAGLQTMLARIGGRSERAEAARIVVAAFLLRVGSAAIAYLAQVVLARWMGAFDYGVFVAVWVWVVLLGAASTLGLNVSIIRFVAEHGERGEFAELRGLLFGSRVFSLALATLVAAAGALGLYLLGDRVTGPYVSPIYLALVCLPLYALTEVQDGLARPYGWVGLALGPPYIWRPLLTLALIVGAHACGLEANATNAMAAAIAATWTTGLVQLLVLQRRLAGRLPRGERSYRVGRWAAVSLPIFLSDSFQVALLNLDVMVLGMFVSPEEVGIYFAAAKTLSLIAFVHFAVGTASIHKFAAHHAAGERMQLERLVREAATWSFWPSLAAAAVMLMGGPFLLALFGPGFVDGYPLMTILAIGLLARSAVGPLNQVLNMLGHEAACARIYGATLAFALVLNLAFVPVFGLAGAAAATTLAMVAESVLLLRAVRQRTGIAVSWRSAVRNPFLPEATGGAV